MIVELHNLLFERIREGERERKRKKEEGEREKKKKEEGERCEQAFCFPFYYQSYYRIMYNTMLIHYIM